ncbi:MAG: DUF3108 domain-containing protein [Hyphomonadaceae bacterium]|nr:DUF3108 domain-containing protein [Hyphomonadaceae bacterium]
MRALLAALVALFAIAAPAWADRFSLRYDGVGLGFVPLGSVVLDADVASDGYTVTATLQSRGLLNLFERTELRAEASGLIRNGAVHWRAYDLDHRYSQKRRRIAMRVGEDGAVHAEIVPNYRIWGQPPATDEHRRQSRDPLSTLIAMAVDVGETRRCSGAYPTFDGRFYYLLELGGGETDDFNDAGYRGEVLRCSLAYIAVAGFERRDAGRRRIPQGQIWFALMPDTSFAPPVRISTPLSAGGAVIRLASFQRPRVEILAEQPPTTAP